MQEEIPSDSSIEPPNKEFTYLDPQHVRIRTEEDDLSFTKEEQKRNAEAMVKYVKIKDSSGTAMSNFDVVEKPRHYNEHKIEAIDVIKLVSRDAPNGFCGSLIGNVQKYIYRCWYKGKDLEDLKKARWYLDRLIKEME